VSSILTQPETTARLGMMGEGRPLEKVKSMEIGPNQAAEDAIC